jgi:antitoxin (DNA-binding transcriptional repressor) of toxin-antitoxin stability system
MGGSEGSQVLDRIFIGEEVVITDKGEPVAKLVSIPATQKKRRKFRFVSAKANSRFRTTSNDPLPKEIEDLLGKTPASGEF